MSGALFTLAVRIGISNLDLDSYGRRRLQGRYVTRKMGRYLSVSDLLLYRRGTQGRVACNRAPPESRCGRSSTRSSSTAQFGEHCFRRQQIRLVVAFGEGGKERVQDVAGLGFVALLGKQMRKADSGAQLNHAAGLPLAMSIACLRRPRLRPRCHATAPAGPRREAGYFRIVKAVMLRIHQVQCAVEGGQRRIELAAKHLLFGCERQQDRLENGGRGHLGRLQHLPDSGRAVVALCRQPAALKSRIGQRPRRTGCARRADRVRPSSVWHAATSPSRRCVKPPMFKLWASEKVWPRSRGHRRRMPRRPLGLIGKTERPQADRIKAARADAAIVAAEIEGVIAVPLAVIEADDLRRTLLEGGEIRCPEQPRNAGVVGLEQQIGIVEFAGDRQQFVGVLERREGASRTMVSWNQMPQVARKRCRPCVGRAG